MAESKLVQLNFEHSSYVAIMCLVLGECMALWGEQKQPIHCSYMWYLVAIFMQRLAV